LRQLVLAVSALHEAGKLHLDLKPSNVLVRADGHVVVLDFGLSRDAAPDLAEAPDRAEEPPAGTPAFMAPEQARGERPTAAADWYAVGVMLYQALTGDLPFSGDLRTLLALKQHADPTPPSARSSGVPDALDSLCLALLRRDPDRRATGVEILRALGDVEGDLRSPARKRAPLIGRERELQALRDAFEETRRGRSVTVYIRGLSGMGKTALAKHFLNELSASRPASAPALVLTGRCYERELVPFKAVDSIIDALAARLRKLPAPDTKALLPHDIQALVRLFPAFEKVVADVHAEALPPTTLDPQELRARGFRAMKGLLFNLALRAPIALFIDDLQWGDGDSAKLLLELFAPPDPPALLLLATYRAEEEKTSPFLRALFGAIEATEGALGAALARFIDVGTLPPDKVSELARTLLRMPDEQASAFAEVVAREAEGSPFFAGELVRHFEERALEMEGGDRSFDRGAEAATGSAAAAPALLELLQKRLDRLPAEARCALEVIAVAARPIEQGVVFRAAGVHDGAAVAAALGTLRAGRWIRSRGASPLDAVETYHDRIREAAAAVSPPRRRAIHLRLAEELEATGRADVEALAIHFGEAGELERGGPYAEVAAGQAEQALAFDNAARLYRLALEWRPGDAAHARALSKKLGDALANAGRGADAAAAYLRAAEGAPRAEALTLERLAAERLLISGRLEEGVNRLRPLLSEAGLPYPESSLAVLGALLWRNAWLSIRGTGYVRRDAAAVDPALLRRMDICFAALRGLVAFDPLRAALYGAEHMRLAFASGEPTMIARGLLFEAVTASMQNSGRALELIELAKEVRRGVESPHLDASARLSVAFELTAAGSYRRGLEVSLEAQAILRESCTGVAWEMSSARMLSTICMVQLGDIAALGRSLPTWLKDAEDRNDYLGFTILYLSYGVGVLAALAAGSPEKAGAGLRAAVSRLPPGITVNHVSALYSRYYLDLYLGEGLNGWRRMQEAWPELQRSLVTRLPLFRDNMWIFRGLSALGAAREAKGWRRARLARAADRDGEAAQGFRAPWMKPYGHMIRAGASALRGDEDAAVAGLRRAAAGFRSFSMALMVAAVERRLGVLLGGSEGRALVSGADAFMARQAILEPARFGALFTPGF
jgi:tetratricopeptide (TPR) repeat protein